MRLSSRKLYQIFGLDAYKDQYGEYIHDVETSLLEWQFEDVGEFIMNKAPNISEKNYIILIEIQNELWIRDMFAKYGKKEKYK